MLTGQFARQNRLTHSKEYQQVFEHPCSKQGDNFLLILARKNSSNEARLGLAVSKKHLKQAVKRNRFKRLVRESFRQHKQTLAGLDLVVMARAGAATIENQAMLSALNMYWPKVIEQCDKS